MFIILLGYKKLNSIQRPPLYRNVTVTWQVLLLSALVRMDQSQMLLIPGNGLLYYIIIFI